MKEVGRKQQITIKINLNLENKEEKNKKRDSITK